jgi:hypothetical protein
LPTTPIKVFALWNAVAHMWPVEFGTPGSP